MTYVMGAAIVAFFYLDGHHFVKNKYMIGLQKFQRINRLVSTNYKGVFKIFRISLCMVVQALWSSFVQYLNTTIKQLDGNRYIVTYIIKGKTYKMLVKLKRGPCNILLVSDETYNDVSYLIFPYLGPSENFHGDVFTPRFFGKKELVFEFSNGIEKIFQIDDNITFN